MKFKYGNFINVRFINLKNLLNIYRSNVVVIIVAMSATSVYSGIVSAFGCNYVANCSAHKYYDT
jgi:hypothetical protein